MRVQLKKSLQIAQRQFLSPGIYTDYDEPIHPKLQELIEAKSKAIIIMPDNTATKKPPKKEEEKKEEVKVADTNTADTGAKDVTTDDQSAPKKAPAAKKKTRKRK